MTVYSSVYLSPQSYLSNLPGNFAKCFISIDKIFAHNRRQDIQNITRLFVAATMLLLIGAVFCVSYALGGALVAIAIQLQLIITSVCFTSGLGLLLASIRSGIKIYSAYKKLYMSQLNVIKQLYNTHYYIHNLYQHAVSMPIRHTFNSVALPQHIAKIFNKQNLFLKFTSLIVGALCIIGAVVLSLLLSNPLTYILAMLSSGIGIGLSLHALHSLKIDILQADITTYELLAQCHSLISLKHRFNHERALQIMQNQICKSKSVRSTPLDNTYESPRPPSSQSSIYEDPAEYEMPNDS